MPAYREHLKVGEFTVACGAQIYLDLLQGGLLGPDQAKALGEWEEFRQTSRVARCGVLHSRWTDCRQELAATHQPTGGGGVGQSGLR